MKKFLIILMICILGIIDVQAYDITDTFYYDTKVENMYITKVKDGFAKNGAPFLLHKSNGELVYCIEPFLYLDNGTYYGYKEFSDIFKLSEAAIEKMNLIAHYGYGYNNHTDLKWYGVTQYLIWNELGLDDLYFTDSYYGNRITAYTNEIDELNNLINNHYKVPSFKDNIELEVNTKVELEDSNNVLGNFELVSDSDSIRIEGNRLVIDTLDEGVYHISFIKKENKEHYMLYYNDNGQNLLLPGKVDDVKKDMTISVKKGSLTIRKHDSKYDSAKVGLTFKGTKYGIYTLDDHLIKEVELDDLGTTNIDIAFGKYYLKEIDAPIGYLKDDDSYYFEVDFNNNDIVMDVTDDIISKKIIIHKLFGNKDTKVYSCEEGVSFEVYDASDNLIGTYTTDKNGNIELNLDYGNYRIHQVDGLDGYTKVDDYNIEVTDTEDFEISLYDNEIPIEVPDTYKDEIDYFGAISVLLILFLFNLGVYAYRKNIDSI